MFLLFLDLHASIAMELVQFNVQIMLEFVPSVLQPTASIFLRNSDLDSTSSVNKNSMKQKPTLPTSHLTTSSKHIQAQESCQNVVKTLLSDLTVEPMMPQEITIFLTFIAQIAIPTVISMPSPIISHNSDGSVVVVISSVLERVII